MAVIASCGDSKSTDPQDGSRPKPPTGNKTDHVFELGFGQTAAIASEDITVTFESMKQDSRCPSDVNCVWAGQAIIGLRLIAAQIDTDYVDLTIHGGCIDECSSSVSSLDTLGYRFELLSLRPYPVSDHYTPPARYEATLGIFPFPSIGALDGEVIISDEDPMAIQRFSYYRDTVVIDGDLLRFHIGYSGGCAEHEFELHMTPAGFFETLPLQADLYLRHGGEPDPCDSYPFRNLTFDLRPILHYYEIQYGQIDCITLNVYDFIRPGQPATKTTVIYHADGATSASWCKP